MDDTKMNYRSLLGVSVVVHRIQKRYIRATQELSTLYINISAINY